MRGSRSVTLIVFVPPTHADAVREAMGNAGAGAIGSYSHCSFSSKGTGRFLPEAGAHPAIGNIGKLEEVAEERIEMICARDKAPAVIAAMKAAHPYEKVAYFVHAMEDM